METSATSVIASLPCPIPLVSTRTKSNPTALQTSMARSIQSAISRPLSLLAKDRMNRLESVSEFILILSPRRAPPVFFRVGSVANRATLASGLSLLIRSMTSSIRLDLPAPPVPVTPTTGQPSDSATDLILARASVNSSLVEFSAIVSIFDTDP